MTEPLYPLSFEPVFQYRLWGGRELGDFMGVPLPGDDPIGEAWILSDRADCSSKIRNGPLKGRTISDLMQSDKTDILGADASRFERLPLLLKFLDVEKMLSVQVHPHDDQKALIPPGDTGKTEAWMVLRAKPGSKVYAGLEPGTTADDLRHLNTAIAGKKLAHFVPKAGEGVMIEAGTVHSLGDGVMVFEVQENSDVTFRLYDWDHVDAKTGKPRPLQIDQALASIDFNRGAVAPIEPRSWKDGFPHPEPVFHNNHFDLVRWQGSEPFPVGADDRARVLVCVEGSGVIESGSEPTPIKRGETILLPAALGLSRMVPEGAATVLEISIPEAK